MPFWKIQFAPSHSTQNRFLEKEEKLVSLVFVWLLKKVKKMLVYSHLSGLLSIRKKGTYFSTFFEIWFAPNFAVSILEKRGKFNAPKVRLSPSPVSIIQQGRNWGEPGTTTVSYLICSDSMHPAAALVEPALQPALQGWAAICKGGRKDRQPVLEARETDQAKGRNGERPGGAGYSAVWFALCCTVGRRKHR